MEPEDAQPTTKRPGQGIGAGMLIVSWVLILGLLAWFFQGWIFTPKATEFEHTQAGLKITLHRHYDHHFRINGQVNGTSVTFLVDTGATTIAIPQDIAQAAKLPQYAPIHIQTANGKTIGYLTRIKALKLNGIMIRNVRAVISPNMNSDEALLGMNVLKKFQMVQEQNTLKLIVPKSRFVKQ